MFGVGVGVGAVAVIVVLVGRCLSFAVSVFCW